MRKKAPRGLVGALIQRHLGFPDAHTGCYDVVVVAVTFAVVVAVFVVVVVAVANDDVTIVTCVTCDVCCLHVLDVVQGCLHLLLEHFVLGTLVH